ncbi:MAG TPA: prepilin-type N-terminal cleavage/methylation domain-containing protein [Patescibacteria group bacterium]|nr:prepilin-type N-terminal cleavage/methylation domain-containing protein [Patescibacteria group bacterium]
MVKVASKGLTLIECMISMLVLAILLMAGMAFYFNAQSLARWSVHKRIALEMANAEMENIKNGGYANLPDPAPAGLWRTSNVTIGNLTGRTDVYVSDSAGYKQVDVEVDWQDPAKGNAWKSIRLVTYMAP